jgi:hypothetical protein
MHPPRRQIQLLLLSIYIGRVFAAIDAIEVGVKDNEVWLTQGRRSIQLTHDGRSKLQAELSNRHDRIAYYEQCPQDEGCMPSVIILNLQGRRIQSFTPTIVGFGELGPCASILGISWRSSDESMAVECHVNPSVSAYMEIDLKTGRHLRDLAGGGFTSSPDGKWVAYVAPLVHFAPPYAKSHYLQLNDFTVYPLPKNMKPLSQQGFQQSIDIVKEEENGYSGIHDFASSFAWSPDSTRVAFVDCVFDWIETGGPDPGGNPIGEERNRKCSIAVVSVTGSHTSIKLPPISTDAIYDSRLSWADSQRLRMKASGHEYLLQIPSR